MTTWYQDDPYLSAVLAELPSEPFTQLEELINRSERDGVFSKEVAQAARAEVLEFLRLYFHNFSWSLWKARSVTALLTREQMLLRLNELGYPLTASYFNEISGPSGGWAGPPKAERWGRVDLYWLDEAIAWAKSHFSSAPGALVDSRVA